MSGEQDFWERLQRKYEEQNRTLLKKEAELQHRLDAMNCVIGEGRKRGSDPAPIATRPAPPPCYQPYPPQYPWNVPPPPPPTPPPPGYTSCTCAHDNRGGFFKGLMSMIPTFKSKGPAPAPPPAPSLSFLRTPSPAPEAKLPPAKNETCICNPCVLEVPPIPEKDESVCNCSICSETSNGNVSKPKKDNNILAGLNKDELIYCKCSVDDVKSSKIPSSEEDICRCSVCSKLSTNKDLCCCNQELKGGPLAQRTDSSSMSLKSLDLYYMKNIHDLAARQKTILSNVKDLEKKAQIYQEVLDEYKDLKPEPRQSVIAERKPESAEKNGAELKLENFLLKNELKEMRLEVRQYIEKMEGPMLFKIESERYKNLQLERKLEEAASSMAELQEQFRRELNGVKGELCNANTFVYNLTTAGQRLREELEAARERCARLEDELVRQKISEGETLKAMQAALKARGGAASLQAEKDECELHQIARELSKIIRECEPCGECVNLPEDLTTAAKLLKSLTDIIDQKLPRKDEGAQDVAERDKECDVAAAPARVETTAAPPAGRDDSVESKLQEEKSQKSVKESPETQAEVVQPEKLEAEKSQTSGKPASEKLENVTPEPPKKEASGNLENSSCQCTGCPGFEEKQRRQQPPEAESKIESLVAARDLDTKESKTKEQERKVSTSKVTADKSCECPGETKKPITVTTTPTEDKACICPSGGGKKEFVPAAYAGTGGARKSSCPSRKSSGKGGSVPVEKLWPTGEPGHHQESALLLPKHLKVQEGFPFKVDTEVDVIEKQPDGVHVTTTVTKSGMLEVVTEGPEGFIETTLIYTASGNVEVVTEILEYDTGGQERSNRGTVKASGGGVNACRQRALQRGAPEAKAAAQLPNCTCHPCAPEGEAETKAETMETPPIVQAQVPPPPIGKEAPTASVQQPVCKCTPCEALQQLEAQQSVAQDPKEREPAKKEQPELPEDCKCTPCDASELAEKDIGPKESTGAKGELPDNCICASCSLLELPATESRAKPEEKGEFEKKQSERSLPSDCQCVNCPGLEEEAAEGSSAESGGKEGNGCKCSSCV